MLTIRPATMADKDAILAFCRETFSWGDYIEHVYDDWVNNPDGELAVAVFEDKPVGISHVLFLSEREAWFEGLRVDPAFRGQGVAKALTNYTRAGCFARGITVGRAFIDGSNTASQSLSAKVGFRRVMEFRAYKRTAQAAATPLLHEVRLATEEDMPQMLDFMLDYTGRIMAWDWHAQEVSAAALARALQDKAIYVVKLEGRITCLAAVTFWPEDGDMDVLSYFARSADDAEPLVWHIVNEQAAGRMREFHIFVTEEQHLLDLAGLGFEPIPEGISGLWEIKL